MFRSTHYHQAAPRRPTSALRDLEGCARLWRRKQALKAGTQLRVNALGAPRRRQQQAHARKWDRGNTPGTARSERDQQENKSESAYKPGSVVDNHSSAARVAADL